MEGIKRHDYAFSEPQWKQTSRQVDIKSEALRAQVAMMSHVSKMHLPHITVAEEEVAMHANEEIC